MATEIPMQVKFHQILALTFPGFFSAITFFMLIDIWSTTNLTFSYVSSENSRIIAFIGLIFVIGTIFGVMNDGLNHIIIEGGLFNKSQEISNIKKGIRQGVKDFYKNTLHRILPCPNDAIDNCGSCCHNMLCPLNESILDDYYIFGKDVEKYFLIDAHLNEEYYSYCSFYSNAFISLVPFSLVLPKYLNQYAQINWNQGLLLGGILLILSGIGLYSSYRTYIYYYQALYSIIRGYVDMQDNQII